MTEHYSTESEDEGLGQGPDPVPSALSGGRYGETRRRAPRLSREDVFEAADGLLLKGQRVTIDRVRQQLGRGSPNTIQEHLERWWSGLGGRIRDLPGEEFPHLPAELSAQVLKLWNTALDTSRESLLIALETREADIEAREAALATREATLNERSEVIEARLQSQSDAASLAREQLLVANQRAEGLESVLKTREAEHSRMAERTAVLEKEISTARAKQEAAAAVHETQKTRLEERYESSEARWLQEVDRARQALKNTTREHERAAREALRKVEALEKTRLQLTRELAQTRTDLRAALKARPSKSASSKAGRKSASAGKREPGGRKRP